MKKNWKLRASASSTALPDAKMTERAGKSSPFWLYSSKWETERRNKKRNVLGEKKGEARTLRLVENGYSATRFISEVQGSRPYLHGETIYCMLLQLVGKN